MSGDRFHSIQSYVPALGVFFFLMSVAFLLHVSVAFAENSEEMVEEPRARLADIEMKEKGEPFNPLLFTSEMKKILASKKLEVTQPNAQPGADLITERAEQGGKKGAEQAATQKQ